MTEGFIKLYRILLDDEIWQFLKPEFKTIMITLLLMASHKKTNWIWNNTKYECSPGEFVTSLESIKKNCGKGVSLQNIRSCLKLLENYNFLTNQSTKQNRKICIRNWSKYQNGNKAINIQLTDNSQSTNNQLTTIKNDKNVKNDKNNTIVEQRAVPPDKIPYKDIVKIFNSICETLPKLKVLSNSRVNSLRLRWGKYGKKHGIEFFRELFERANDSDFLSGRNGKWTACNFDWLIKETNMIKVMEGNYDNRTGN